MHPLPLTSWKGLTAHCVFATMLLTCLSLGTSLHAATPPPVEAILRNGVVESLLESNADAPIQETALTPAAVRVIVRENLDANLMTSARLAAGKDFRFLPAGHETSVQVALLVLTYPTERTAERMARRLACRKGYFRNTKILTRFSYGQSGAQLVIAYTENAGSEAVVQFVSAFPERFKAASNQ